MSNQLNKSRTPVVERRVFVHTVASAWRTGLVWHFWEKEFITDFFFQSAKVRKCESALGPTFCPLISDHLNRLNHPHIRARCCPAAWAVSHWSYQEAPSFAPCPVPENIHLRSGTSEYSRTPAPFSTFCPRPRTPVAVWWYPGKEEGAWDETAWIPATNLLFNLWVLAAVLGSKSESGTRERSEQARGKKHLSWSWKSRAHQTRGYFEPLWPKDQGGEMWSQLKTYNTRRTIRLDPTPEGSKFRSCFIVVCCCEGDLLLTTSLRYSKRATIWQGLRLYWEEVCVFVWVDCCRRTLSLPSFGRSDRCGRYPGELDLTDWLIHFRSI